MTTEHTMHDDPGAHELAITGESEGITLDERCQPTPNSECFTMTAPGGETVVIVRFDGSVEYGPGFTTNDEAAKMFWESMGRTFAITVRTEPTRFEEPLASPSNE